MEGKVKCGKERNWGEGVKKNEGKTKFKCIGDGRAKLKKKKKAPG